ncbi:MAG: hypothetical protein K6F33_02425, partial [Bacteroidales bacterium]|nr:hypothetical protein [Bacteroidales bacterium]
MRRKFALFLLCAATLAACQIDDEMYTSYDVYYPTAFATDSTNAVLGSAAMADVVVSKLDDRLIVEGGFMYMADNVVGYGHCWEKGKVEPVINEEGTNCVYMEGKPSDNVFQTPIVNLECETEYSIRSFVVIKDKDGKEIVGYNTETLVAVTDMPHDKWFESNKFLEKNIIAGRS